MRTIFTFTLLLSVILPWSSFAGSGPSHLSAGSGGSVADRMLIGFRGGVNFTLPMPVKRFSVIQNLDGTQTDQGRKDYGAFYKNPGYQYGFSVLYRINGKMLLSLEPTFASYVIKYETKSVWNDAGDNGNRIEINTAYADRLKYFEIPLELRVEMGSGQIRPYLAAGLLYGIRTGAMANAESEVVQYIDDVAIDLENTHAAGDVSGNFIHSRLAVFPGAGVFVDLGGIVLYGEADYYFGLHNVVDESARYLNQQTVGSSYDVPDNLKPDNLAIQIGILFRIGSGGSSGGSSSGKGKGSAVPCPVIKLKR